MSPGAENSEGLDATTDRNPLSKATDIPQTTFSDLSCRFGPLSSPSPSFAVPRARFFFNDSATTEIFPLPLHDALPIPQTGFNRLGGKSGTRIAIFSPAPTD